MIRITAYLMAAVAAVLGALAVTPANATPTLEQLANTAYTGIFEHAITLTNGRWEGEPFVAGGASRPAVGLVEDFILTGDLNDDGHDEAVVLLWESTGGSGIYNYIAVTGMRDDKPYALGTALIGERVQVRSGRITGNRIELDVVQQGPGDAACCPSQKATRYWTLDATGLHVHASRITGRLSLADLAGPEWVLNRLDANKPLAAQPEITLLFDGDRVSGKSACNRYFAGVKETGEQPGDLRISRIGGTRMACPKELMNLENRYLEALGKVTRYSFQAGKLALTWRKDAETGTLLFVPRQPLQP
jgi:heat shock protein HslJ